MSASKKTPLLTAAAISAAAVAMAFTGRSTVAHSAGPVANAAATTINISDDAFSKSSVSIKRNQTITWNWQNTDDSHNVSVKKGPVRFHSKTEDGMFSFSHKFTTAGTYKLHCTIHPDEMKITVKVTK